MTKELYFIGTINRKNVSRCISNMNKNRINRLYLSSSGGEVTEAIRLCETIRLYHTKINIQVRGEASSAATLILASATGRREMTINSHMMYHNVYIDSFSDKLNASNSIEQHNIFKFYEKLMENVYGTNSEETKNFYLDIVKKSNKDIYITSSDALRYGLIDKVV